MIHPMTTDQIRLLKKIANYLVINSSFLKELGLFRGKAGILLFLYSYARYTRNHLYEEYAGLLIDEIFEEIHDDLNTSLSNGYCGIGWSICYLTQEKFISGDICDILQDIDEKIMERDLRRIKDYSIPKGLGGILHYTLNRLTCIPDAPPFDSLYLEDLYRASFRMLTQTESPELIQLGNQYISWKEQHTTGYSTAQLFQQLPLPSQWKHQYRNNREMGLAGGCAGYGLYLLRS